MGKIRYEHQPVSASWYFLFLGDIVPLRSQNIGRMRTSTRRIKAIEGSLHLMMQSKLDMTFIAMAWSRDWSETGHSDSAESKQEEAGVETP